MPAFPVITISCGSSVITTFSTTFAQAINIVETNQIPTTQQNVIIHLLREFESLSIAYKTRDCKSMVFYGHTFEQVVSKIPSFVMSWIMNKKS